MRRLSRSLAPRFVTGLVCVIGASAAGCGHPSSGSRAQPTASADAPAPKSPHEASKPLIVLEQRDDRDIVSAESFLTAHRTVVLLSFRQPNRHRQAGQALVLDTHDEVVSSRLLPTREGEAEGPRLPALRYLDDPSDRTDGLVLDLVPETDPLGGAMVGNVHVLGRGAGLTTKPMPAPPRDTRWAGPTLAWAAEGELLVLLRTTRGEQVFAPFASGGQALRTPRTDEASPPVAAAGPAITTETRCDDAGCHTSVRLALGDRRRAALQGKGSGSLQQRTPVE